MLEQWYPSWFSALSEADLAYAFMGAGLVKPDVDEAEEAVRVILARLLDGVPMLLHHLPLPNRPWLHALPPMELADAYRSAATARPLPARRFQGRGTTVAIESRRLKATATGEAWIADVRDAIRTLGEHQLVIHSPSGAITGWSWPVRVAVFSAGYNLGGFEAATNHHWHGTLFHLANARLQDERFDVLLVEGDGGDLVDAMADAGASARAVVLMGDPLRPLKAEVKLLERACGEGDAAAVARTLVPSDRAAWLLSLIEELAHALPFHRAVDRIADRHSLPPPWVLGNRLSLGNLDLMHGTEELLHRVDRLVAPEEGGVGIDPSIEISGRLRRDFDLTSETSMGELAGDLRSSMGSLAFDFESEGATTVAETFIALDHAERMTARRAAAEEAEAMAAPRMDVGMTGESTIRILRSRLCRGGEKLPFDTVLEPQTSYAVEVSIGPPSEKWLGQRTPFVEPDLPPDDPRGWRLRVVAWDPNYMPEPQERRLWLGQSGPTDSVKFDFRTNDEVAPLGVRVIVLHGNRVLQTGLLRRGETRLSWSIDAAPEPELTGFDPDRWFAASITLNNDVDGNPTATTVSDGSLGVAELPLDTFESFTATVTQQLSAIAASPGDFTALESDGTVALLRSLAQSGANLRRALILGTAIEEDRLTEASRIQIVSTKALTFFPAEFLYSLPPPRDTAVLCPAAKAALTSVDGKCTANHDRDHVCPTGFWSMSKVLERHAHVPANTQFPGPFSLFARGRSPRNAFLNPLRQVLYAACDIADEVDPTATSSLETRATAVAGDLARVNDWNEWEEHVKTDKPSLLVLMPHHFGSDKLRIGENADLSPSGVVEDIVRVDDAPVNPIVLLVGCKTLLTKKAFNDFVQNFQWSGASIVVATYGTILGRHAAPATASLIEAIKDRLDHGPVRFGDLLLSLRRKLLAEGAPMALGLTSHGDADLVLDRGGN